MTANSIIDEQFINKLTQVINENLHDENFGAAQLAAQLGMSRITLYRKVKAVVKKSVSEFIRETRLKRACQLLCEKAGTVSEIAYNVGFNNPAYFNKCFHEYYDCTPGDVLKGKHVNQKNEGDQFGEKRKLKLYPVLTILVIALIFLVGFIWLYRKPHLKELEKTILIIPFMDDSPEEGNAYIINGLMEEILSKLRNVGELKVKSRTDSEKYRDTKKGSSEIAKEQHVNYLLEGSGQKIGDDIKLHIQLIEAKTGINFWSHDFTERVENIFTLQENVALSVASELKANLTPEEKQQIKQFSTENYTALKWHEKGKDYHKIAVNLQANSDKSESKTAFLKGKECTELAVALDSTYVDALVWLSHYYINIFIPMARNNPQLQINYLDSGRYYAEKALKYDPKNNWATGLMERYYRKKGMEKEAEVFEKRLVQIQQDIKFPEYDIYRERLERANKSEDYHNAIKYYYKYLEIKPDLVETPIYLLQGAYDIFECSGYPELAKSIAKELLTRNNDSIAYWLNLARLNFIYENDCSFKFLQKVLEKESAQNAQSFIWYIAHWNKDLCDQIYYLQKVIEAGGKSASILLEKYEDANIWLQNGFKYDTGSSFYDKSRYIEQIELKLPESQKYYSHLNIAYLYAIEGDKEKALKYLKQIQERETAFPYIIIKVLETYPKWDILRNEPEFQKTLAVVEAKYEKEHKRIGKLLIDLGVIEKEPD